MNGEAYTARTSQPDFLWTQILLPQLGHLTAQGLLVTLAKQDVVMEENISDNIAAISINRTDTPIVIDRYIIVPGENHDGHLHDNMQESLVGMEKYHIVGKTEIIPCHALTDKGIELAVEVSHTLGKLTGLLLRPAGHETVGDITTAPVSHLIQILGDIKDTDDGMVEITEQEIRKQLGYLHAQGKAVKVAVDELIKERKQLGILDFTPELILYKAVHYELEVMVGIEGSKIKSLHEIYVKPSPE